MLANGYKTEQDFGMQNSKFQVPGFVFRVAPQCGISSTNNFSFAMLRKAGCHRTGCRGQSQFSSALMSSSPVSISFTLPESERYSSNKVFLLSYFFNEFFKYRKVILNYLPYLFSVNSEIIMSSNIS